MDRPGRRTYPEATMCAAPFPFPADLDCATLLDQLPVALALVTRSDGRLAGSNAAFQQLFGPLPANFDTWWSQVSESETRPRLDAVDDEDLECDLRSRDGLRRHMHGRVRQFGPYAMLCLFDMSDDDARQDILRQALAEMEARSTTDALTGLPSRRRLEEASLSEMHRFRRFGHPISLLIADIDHFKQINDRHGHLAGDEVLVEFARRLVAECRELDVVSRYGGEEFVILLPGTPLAGATTLAEKLRLAIYTSPFATVGTLSASFGAAECLADESWERWLSRADQALYRAKAAGRNQVHCAPETAFDEKALRHRSRLDRLTWDDGHCVGDPVIDGQHHQLFELANRLLNLVREARPPLEIHATIRDLVRATGRHFRDEEAILASVAYPRTEQHARAHRVLTAKLDALSTQSAHGALPTAKLIEFLAYDLVDHHALGADRDFIPWLRLGPRDTPPPDS